MCCLVTVLVFLGPRLGILVWWLLDMPRWNLTFNTFIWPLLGFIFLPWTTLAYVLVFPWNNRFRLGLAGPGIPSGHQFLHQRRSQQTPTVTKIRTYVVVQ